MNRFIFEGTVSAPIELSETTRRTPVATILMAIPREDGAGVDVVPVTTFGKQAENDARYLRPGSALAVIGRVTSWGGGLELRAERVIYGGLPADHAG